MRAAPDRRIIARDALCQVSGKEARVALLELALSPSLVLTVCFSQLARPLTHSHRSGKFETKFTRYAQSGPIRNAQRDTSVSYASATVVPVPLG